jgi:(heptosyl)LPS beta-1,4-glucosyltransferase
MNKISAVIAIHNKDNTSHLSELLSSLENLAEQIVLVDIGMLPDLRQQLENDKRVELVNIKEKVPYIELIREKTKQFAKNDYVFFLDADEVISQGLAKIIKKNIDNYDYFVIPRKNVIFNKWIQNSRWWPDYQIRLFKKDAVTWPVEIHSQPVVKGKEYKVSAQENLTLIHYNYNTLDEYLEKAVRYAKAEAHDIEKKSGKFTLHDAIKKAISEFISRYFANEGYKDGMHGFVLSFLQMFYYFLVYFYSWESNKYPEVSTKEIVQNVDEYFKQGLYETKFWKQNKQLEKSFSEKIKTAIIKKM